MKTNEESEYYLFLLNEEVLKMRKELYKCYFEFLENFHCKEDVDRSLHYFLGAPSENVKGVSTIEYLLRCCEVAKFNRENK